MNTVKWSVEFKQSSLIDTLPSPNLRLDKLDLIDVACNVLRGNICSIISYETACNTIIIKKLSPSKIIQSNTKNCLQIISNK